MITTSYRFLSRVVAVAAIATATLASAESPSTLYVPGALAGSDPQIWTDIWAHNNGSAEGVVRFLSVWDAAGAHDIPASEAVPIAAGDAIVLVGHTHPNAGQSVQFLAFSVTPGIVIRPRLRRSQGGDSAGALTLPTFTSVVPANSKTIAGSFDISWAECSVFGAARHLNVTLLNAGDAPGTFHVIVQTRDHGIDTRPSHSGEPTVVDYLVPARSVHQINDVPYDLPALCGKDRTWAMGWVEITADQPYLAYASTVRQDAPGVLPYEVFPAVTGQ